VASDLTRAILARLSELGSRTLRACSIAGMTAERACPESELLRQLSDEDGRKLPDALRYLARFDPPLIQHVGREGHRFTYEGGLAAAEVMRGGLERAKPAPEVPVFITSQKLLDEQMAEHAAQVGAEIWKANKERCDGCGHNQSYGLRRGNRRLCQICFKRGRRFRLTGT
jgi:hypothetical protein